MNEYLARFNMLALEIKNLNEGIVVYQIMIRFQAGHFSLSLAKKLAIFLVDLLAQLKKYINIEEVKIAQR